MVLLCSRVANGIALLPSCGMNLRVDLLETIHDIIGL